jgi:5-methylcytosine-specific restriction endonuclease McrA
MIFPDIVIRLLEKSLPRQVWYRDYYLQSKHWQRFRAKAKRHYGNRCARCYRVGLPGVVLDVHHHTYSRLWAERLEDVQILCRECHNTKHA